jgi:hypothetical protein
MGPFRIALAPTSGCHADSVSSWAQGLPHTPRSIARETYERRATSIVALSTFVLVKGRPAGKVLLSPEPCAQVRILPGAHLPELDKQPADLRRCSA